MRSARAALSGVAGVDGAVFGGAIAGDDVAVAMAGASVGAAAMGGTIFGVARAGGFGGFGGAAADGGVIGAALAGGGALGGAAGDGGMIGVALVGGGVLGDAAGDGGMIGAAAFSNIVLGTRKDFLHRLQSNVLTGAVALRATGAEQCGQSKRISLLAVPVFDAPPFCIVGNGSSRYTIIVASQVGASNKISNSDFAPTRHCCPPC